MSDNLQLRTAIIGLLGYAAVEAELLLAGLPQPAAEPGSPTCWAALPLVAHNTEFKRQQVVRLDAIRRGETPPAFAEIDHRSDEVYLRYCQLPADEVVRAGREVTAALIDGLGATSDDDLLDPSRNPWLDGRQLWLQIIVRGFWHPMGHIGDYYIGHAQPGRAVALQSQVVAMASYLDAPDPACGMAHYNLACAQACADLLDAAIDSLRRADDLNPGLLAKASNDADFSVLRDSGRLDQLPR